MISNRIDDDKIREIAYSGEDVKKMDVSKIVPIEVPDPTKLVTNAIEIFKATGKSSLMYNEQTGALAAYNRAEWSSCLGWYPITDKFYPKYDGTLYVGDSVGEGKK